MQYTYVSSEMIVLGSMGHHCTHFFPVLDFFCLIRPYIKMSMHLIVYICTYVRMYGSMYICTLPLFQTLEINKNVTKMKKIYLPRP